MKSFRIINRIKQDKDHISIILQCVFSIFLFLFCIRHISETSNLIVWDELGYWGSAAYYAGYDWSSIVTANSGYYSYGYSLILALLLYIFAPLKFAYQAAIIVNALLSVGSYILANYVGCFFVKKEKKLYVVIAAFAVSMYGNNITQTCFAWPEVLLIFLFWTLVALFVSLYQRYRLQKVLLICVVLVYMFFVHSRTIGVVIAGFLSIIVFVSRKFNKKDLWKISFIAALIVTLFGLGQFIREDVKNEVWRVLADTPLANTSSVLITDTVNKFTVKGVWEIIKTFFNRIYYWGCVSYFFVFACIKELCIRLYLNIKNKEWNPIFLFLILSMLGNFGVLSLTLSFQGTYQALLYGRYADNIIGPFLLLGLLFFFTKENTSTKKNVVWELFVYEIIMMILYINVRSIEINRDYFVANCNVDFYKYWIGTEKGGYNFPEFMLIAILVYSCMLIVRWMLNHDKKILAWIAIVILLSVYSKNKYDVSESVFYKTYTNCDGMTKIIDDIARYCDNYELVYFYHDSNWRCTPLEMWIQFRMYDKKVVDVSSLEKLSDCMVLIPRELVQEGTYLPSTEVFGELILEDKYISLYKFP